MDHDILPVKGAQIPNGEVPKTHSVGAAHELWEASLGQEPELWYKFKRFESLALFNLFLYQDQLVELQGDIDEAEGRLNADQRTKLRLLLKEYYESIRLFGEVAALKRPPMNKREQANRKLYDLLKDSGLSHDGHYKWAADALGMVDLSPQALGVEPDRIRVFLGDFNILRASTDDTLARHPDKVVERTAGVEDRIPKRDHNAVESKTEQDDDVEDGGQTPNERKRHRLSKTYQIFRRINTRLRPIPISWATDVTARIITAVFTGVVLLVPIIALSYISTTGYRLLATCLFVLGFAIIASVAIASTNNELVGATAAYAALLVVFLGQTTSPSG